MKKQCKEDISRSDFHPPLEYNEVVLIDEFDEDIEEELPFGFEDYLYEMMKENEYLKLSSGGGKN